MTDPRPDVVVVTVEGDTVDLVAWRVLGPGYRAAVRGILEANPGIAAPGAVLPTGTEVVVPASVRPDDVGERPVRLWD